MGVAWIDLLLLYRRVFRRYPGADGIYRHLFQHEVLASMIPEIFQQVESDGLFWRTLRNTIQASLATLPDVSWRPKFAFPILGSDTSDIQRTKHAAIRALGLTSEDSMRAIYHTMNEHEWPELEPPQVWSLTIALGEIVRFLDLCFAEDGGQSTTLFRSLPDDNLTTAALWFCFQWWPSNGARRWIDDSMRDEASFYRHFERPQEE